MFEQHAQKEPAERPAATTDAPVKRAPGRPARYSPAAVELAEQGLLLSQIADHFGVDVRTCHLWQHRRPEFRSAVLRGRDRRRNRRQYEERRQLAERVTSLRQMIAEAMPAIASGEPARTPEAAQRSQTSLGHLAALRRDPAKPSYKPARYAPPEPEPEQDAFDGEPWPLDDPRAGW